MKHSWIIFLSIILVTALVFSLVVFNRDESSEDTDTPYLNRTENSDDATEVPENVTPSAEPSYTVQVDEDGNTTVVDKNGNTMASTESGDSITVKEDGSVIIESSDGISTTLPAETTAVPAGSNTAISTTSPASAETEPAVDKADTSGMDFDFDEEDTSAETPSNGTSVDVSNNTTQTNSGTNLYNITSGGTYTLSGNITDTMVTVDAGNADVTIILDGATIKNSKGPAIYVRSADKVTVTLASGTTNTISDGSSYSITDSDSTLDAAVFSKADLTVNGSGILNLTGNYKHGIVSKDDLVISSGTIKVTANNVGLNGKDCVKINSGNITINAGSDGIRSDNTEDTDRGYVYLYGGTVSITAGNDGIQAETVIKIEDVNLSITAGGGSSESLSSSSESYKGLKASSDIYITGGTFNINSKDDCIHSNGTITIAGGTYTLSSGDDGIHADTDLAISGSATNLTVNKSYEGIEATNVVITGGTVSVIASDDGINAAGGNDSTSADTRPGQNSFSSSNGSIKISGGMIYIKMCGDGIDANGTLDITGGSITVSGANSGDTAILDFDSTGNISGGTFIGTGASGMAQNFSSSSAQGAIMVNASGSAGTVIKLTDSNGNVILTHTADQSFSCVIISHASIVKGGTYTLTVGSSVTSITMSDTVYSAGSTGGLGGTGGPGGRK